jgi:hypothetical protein
LETQQNFAGLTIIIERKLVQPQKTAPTDHDGLKCSTKSSPNRGSLSLRQGALRDSSGRCPRAASLTSPDSFSPLWSLLADLVPPIDHSTFSFLSPPIPPSTSDCRRRRVCPLIDASRGRATRGVVPSEQPPLADRPLPPRATGMRRGHFAAQEDHIGSWSMGGG